MVAKSLSLLVVLVALTSTAQAFAPAAATTASSCIRPTTTATTTTTSALQAVVDIDSENAFDQTIKNAGDSLVVVDYSTTWCGPCKVIAPKFDELSEKYPDAVFLKVRTSFMKRTEERVMKQEREPPIC